MEVQGHLKSSVEECSQAGDYAFTELNEKYHLGFICPCGCGDWTGILVSKDGTHSPKVWGWNKSMEKPTCTPSILRLDRCKWHGYLTDGVFRSV